MRRLAWGGMSHHAKPCDFFFLSRAKKLRSPQKNKTMCVRMVLIFPSLCMNNLSAHTCLSPLFCPINLAALPRMLSGVSSHAHGAIAQHNWRGVYVYGWKWPHTSVRSFLQLPHVVTQHSFLLCTGTSELASLILWHVSCVGLNWIDGISLAKDKHILRIPNSAGWHVKIDKLFGN